jgi:hypothetical protein
MVFGSWLVVKTGKKASNLPTVAVAQTESFQADHSLLFAGKTCRVSQAQMATAGAS